MKVNDNQRREAAREIRQFLSVSQNERAWDNDRLQTVGRLVGTSVGENILVRLAELIDRPTCKNLATKAADELLCSECGEHVDIAYVENADDYHARYCPNCGAEVVE